METVDNTRWHVTVRLTQEWDEPLHDQPQAVQSGTKWELIDGVNPGPYGGRKVVTSFLVSDRSSIVDAWTPLSRTEADRLASVQVQSCLDCGWSPEEIDADTTRMSIGDEGDREWTTADVRIRTSGSLGIADPVGGADRGTP